MTQPIDQLLEIMARLRAPDGCPWDREQDFGTIAPYTIEEAYEVADAIARQDMADLKDELGDLLLQVVFHSQMAAEQQDFTFHDVARHIAEKMIRRHPHVFGDETQAEDAEAVKDIWEQQKSAERAAKQGAEAANDAAKAASVLDGVALGLPALMRAQKLSKRAARTGFEWPDVGAVFDKLDEEAGELQEAIREGYPQEALEEELGDLLFVTVNIARHLDVDAETALRNANLKFERRFKVIEQQIAKKGKSINQASMGEMQAAWDEAKRLEKLKEAG